jgi:Leucine-rich repeat (LRR) protein
MFPEHRWIPYKLEHLDLSHNNMPVITKEMLVGTKHLKYLNISYNILTDIRKGNLLLQLKIIDKVVKNCCPAIKPHFG